MGMEHTHTLPAFDLAIDRFELFLTEQGQSRNTLWIFREDVTWHGGRFFIKLPLPGENRSLVAQLYERGCVRGLGALIDVFCLVNSQPYCYIWIPTNEREAELAQLAGLNLSAPSNPQVAQPVFSDALWRFHAWLGKRSGADKWLDRLPNRGRIREA
jgi:hypothetical protein